MKKELYISYLSLNYHDGSAYVFQQGETISKNKRWKEFSKEKQTKYIWTVDTYCTEIHIYLCVSVRSL